MSVVEDALALAPIVDGHNDLAWVRRDHFAYSVDGIDADLTGLTQTDLPRLRAGRVGAQFWSVYAPCEQRGADAVQYTLEQIDFVHRLVAQYPEQLTPARSADDVLAAWKGGRIGSLLGAEGGHCINGSLAVLRQYAQLGVRYLTLTHNENTPWADSATDQPDHRGLTAFGREVVREMNTLGMLVDLSHVAATTMHDALDTTSAPVIFSHSGCRAVNDHPRNVPDDVLFRLRANGGVIMVTFVPPFLTDEFESRPTTVHDVVRHVEHAREIAGLEHIGLGGDYDGYESFPERLEDVSGYPVLLEALAARGWTADELAALAGGNILRVLAAVP